MRGQIPPPPLWIWNPSQTGSLPPPLSPRCQDARTQCGWESSGQLRTPQAAIPSKYVPFLRLSLEALP